MDFSRLTLEDARLRDQNKRAAEEANLWRIQREDAERRDAEIRDRKKEAAVAAARQAAIAPGARIGTGASCPKSDFLDAKSKRFRTAQEGQYQIMVCGVLQCVSERMDGS